MVEFKLENPDKHDKKREELYTKVLSLKDVVAYQDGTVASRMIINKKQGVSRSFHSMRMKDCRSIRPRTTQWLLSLMGNVKCGLPARHSR